MPTTLVLKARDDTVIVSIPLVGLRTALEMGQTEGAPIIWDQLVKFRDIPARRHDREWLALIVNWVDSDKGLPLTETAKWFRLARKVGELSDDSESITLTLTEVDLIWSRMQDSRFVVRGTLPIPFVEFLLDFCDATGRQFATIVKDNE